jgi:hypothetical protein
MCVQTAIARQANDSPAPRSALPSKTRVLVLGLIAAITAAASIPAIAAPNKKCDAGTYWSKAKRACVAAGSEVRSKRMCKSFTDEGGLGSRPFVS